MMAFLLVTSLTFTLISISQAIPQTAFPVNSQVPPLAQAGQVYNFQFAPNTFVQADLSPFTYSIRGAPRWLSLQSSTRFLFGTPDIGDVGDFTFELVASDAYGSASQSVTLIVTDVPSPLLQTNLTEVLSSSGPLSDPSSLSVYPGETFRITFPRDTFTAASNLTYYATSADRSPLPSWIRFDPATNTLSGITPPPVPNPQSVGVQLIASSVVGFAAQSICFNMVISDHRLVFTSVLQSVLVEADGTLLTRSELLLDGLLPPKEAIASAKVNASTWIHFDPDALTISGQVPPGFNNEIVEVVASDIYDDSAYTYLNITKNSPGGAVLPHISPRPSSTVSSSNGESPTNASSSVYSVWPSPDQPHSKKRWIPVAVILPVVASFILALGTFIFWFRRRMRSKQTQGYVDDLTKKNGFEREEAETAHERGSPQKVTTTYKPGAKRTNPGRANRTLRFSRESPTASPEQRILDSSDQSLSALGLFVPDSASLARDDMHPLRSNAIPPPGRTSRLSRQGDRWTLTEMRGGRSGARWSRSSAHPSTNNEGSVIIPKCENCESDKLRCIDCGSRQIKSALEHVKAQRRSRVNIMNQHSLRVAISDGRNTSGSVNEDKGERERREAIEYVSRPLQERFQQYQSQRKAVGARERFSNNGSISQTSSYATHRQQHLNRPDRKRHRNIYHTSDNSVFEESPVIGEGHFADDSQGSSRSWVTEGRVSSQHRRLGSSGSVEEQPQRAGRYMRRISRNQSQYADVQKIGAIRQVPPQETDGEEEWQERTKEDDVSAGLKEEIPSSDKEAFI